MPPYSHWVGLRTAISIHDYVIRVSLVEIALIVSFVVRPCTEETVVVTTRMTVVMRMFSFYWDRVVFK
jgi:hypothetical protein